MANPRENTCLNSALGAIGNTPFVALSRPTHGMEGRILAKLEYLNPGFSKKDCIALQMIEEAEAQGNSTERARMMKALGAEVILIDQLPGSKPGQISGGDQALVEQAAQRITRERNAFRADQFRLPGSARAHYLYTAPEIIRQSNGKIDVYCEYVGTGSTFGGCAAAFKEYDLKILCYVDEPAGAAVLAGRPVTNPNHSHPILIP